MDVDTVHWHYSCCLILLSVTQIINAKNEYASSRKPKAVALGFHFSTQYFNYANSGECQKDRYIHYGLNHGSKLKGALKFDMRKADFFLYPSSVGTGN